jgi:nucleoside-diphosphate-sugar epimerase
MDKGSTILVTGAGGFIGGHIVNELMQLGYQSVRGVDIKPLSEWYQHPQGEVAVQADLQKLENAIEATKDVRYVINLAADMGGMGFIENNKALCMLSVLVNTHLLRASLENGVERFFFSSSACVYAAEHQTEVDVIALKESDAYPAMPEDGYGWEKLFSERMCRHFSEDFGLQTRVARYHNIYGPEGTWNGGREKAPAAMCRKVAEAVLTGRHSIDIWGDGLQTRSFTYISDCVQGTLMLLESDFDEPINIGSNEMVSINQLVDIVEEIAEVSLERKYDLDAPKGVRGRNSNNTLIESVFNWQPSTSLKDGLEVTYRWVYDQVAKELLK